MKSGVSGSLFRLLAERGLDDEPVFELLVFTVELRSRDVLTRDEVVLCKTNNANMISCKKHASLANDPVPS